MNIKKNKLENGKGKISTNWSIWGKRLRSWSKREGIVGKRIGEVEEEQRSLLDNGGEGGSCSSKKDLLLPHTAADIVLPMLTIEFEFDPISSSFSSSLIFLLRSISNWNWMKLGLGFREIGDFGDGGEEKGWKLRGMCIYRVIKEWRRKW